MKVVYIERKKTKLIKEENVYEDGSNWPTNVKTYKCFCKKGKIIEKKISGFDDHFAYIECENCLKKYSPYLDFSFNDWEVREL